MMHNYQQPTNPNGNGQAVKYKTINFVTDIQFNYNTQFDYDMQFDYNEMIAHVHASTTIHGL